MGSLIDSSIFIAAERGEPALRTMLTLLAPSEGEFFISAAREAYVENALQTFPIVPFDEPAARVFASIDATLSAAGNRLAVEDLMIAATALAKGYEVVTRDLRSFPRVPGLQWIEW